MNRCLTVRLGLLLTLLFLDGTDVGAQPMELRGRVTDAGDGNPLPQLTVMLQLGGKKILKYTLTDKNGFFRMEFREEGVAVGAELVFSYMGYEEQRIPVTAVEIAAGKTYSVAMKPGSLQIKEVIVQAPKIQMRGDTISYNVQSFANAQDKSIADVLKRMPGMEVDEGGKVKYNGEPINKFYIEGADLLEGRYGLATKNINQKDVAKVEVLENHQPVKALKNTSFSDKSAINIKLREGAKANWIIQLSAGGGVGEGADVTRVQGDSESRTEQNAIVAEKRHFLWDGNLFAMRIAGKNQSLNILKTNNTGNDLAGMSKSFTLSDLNDQLYSQYTFPSYIALSPAGVPNMDGERTRFNKSLLLNSSNLWNLGENYSLKGEVAYLYQKIESANLSGTEYFFDTGNWVDDEWVTALQTYQGAQVGIDLTSNTEMHYLKNSLKADARWGDTRSYLQWSSRQYQNRPEGNSELESLSGNRVYQRGKLPVLNLSNEFRWVKNRRNTTLTLFSGNKFHQAPQSLEVFFLPEDEPKQEVSALEKVHTRTFLTDESLTFATTVHKWSLAAVGGFAALFRNMQREDTQLDNRLGRLDGYLRLKAVYESERFRTVFELPGGYSGFSFREGGQWFWTPGVSFRWKINSRLWMNLRGTLGQTPLSTDWFFSGTILNNYKNAQQGAVYDAVDRYGNMYLGVNYKDPLSLFYASLSVSCNLNRNSTLNDLIFTDTYLLNTLILQQNDFKGWNFRGELSKGLDFLKGKVSLEGSYALFEMQTMRNGLLSPYQSRALNLKGYLNSEFANWGNLDYDLRYGRNGVVLENGTISSSDFVKQQLSLNFTPMEWLILKIKGEHYYTQLSSDLFKHLFWLDAGVTFRINEKTELMFSVTNLLNTKTYTYVIYNGLSAVSRQYALRPLNVIGSIFVKL